MRCLQKRFHYLGKIGVKPEVFDAKTLDKVLPSNDPKDSRRYYYTALYRNQVLSDFFKIGTDILKTYASDPKTTANFGEYLTFTGNMLHAGDDWFLIFDSGALTYGWTEDWLNLGTSYQLCGYRADFLRAASKNHFGMYCIFRNPWDTQAKVASEIGHGAQAIRYYNYGPYYAMSVDQSSTNYSLYPAVQKINHSIGTVEDYIIEASVPKSSVALLYSHTTDVWTLKQGSSVFVKERMGLWLILKHLGYSIDIITEQDVINKKIKDYKVTFVGGSHLPIEVVQGLSEWTRDGGTLVIGSGTGIYDRFNSPSNSDTHFGIKREEFVFKDEPGDDYYTLPGLKPLDFISLKDLTTSETIEVLCGYQKIGKEIFQKRERLRNSIRTIYQWEKEKQRIKENFEQAIEEKFPKRNVKIVHKGEIRKIVFSLHKDHWVTALLCIPLEGRYSFPGILLSVGHSIDGKFTYNELAVFYASNGYVAITYDFLGQGERALKNKSEFVYAFPSTAHNIIGVPMTLYGYNLN